MKMVIASDFGTLFLVKSVLSPLILSFSFFFPAVLAAQLADKVTTLLYILSQPEKPEVEVVGPILDEIEIFATKLIYAFYSLPKDSGLTLRKQYHQDVLRVIEDLIGVLEALEKLEYVE